MLRGRAVGRGCAVAGVALCAALLLAGCGKAASPAPGGGGNRFQVGRGKLLPSYAAETIEELLALPPEAFDIATAALLIERGLDPTVDVAALREALDAWVAAFGVRHGAVDDPAILAETLVREMSVFPVASLAETNKYGRLSGLLRGRPSSCVVRSTFCMAACKRLGIPANMVVRTIAHVLVRHRSGDVIIDLETMIPYDPMRPMGEAPISPTCDYEVQTVDELVAIWLTQRSRLELLVAGDPEERPGVSCSVPGPGCGRGAFLPVEDLYRVAGFEDARRATQLAGPMLKRIGFTTYIHFARAEYAQAVQSATQCLYLCPQDPYMLSLRGMARARTGDEQGALEDAEAALALDPMHMGGLMLRASIAFQEGDYETTLRDNSRLIELGGQGPEAFGHRAYLLLRQGRYEDAIADYTTAIELGANDASVFYARAECHAMLDLYERAVEDFTEAIGRSPGVARYYSRRADAYAALGEYEPALVDCEKALQLDPGDRAARGLKVDALIRLDDVEAALQETEAWLTADPSDVYAHYMQGWVRMRQEAYSEGRRHFDAALRIAPNFSWAQASRGLAAAYVGEEDAARADIAQAVRAAPGDSIVRQLEIQILAVLEEPEAAWEVLHAARRAGVFISLEIYDYLEPPLEMTIPSPAP